MKKLFGTDGIRGIAYGFLDANLARKTGAALGEILGKKGRKPRVVIGGDTRESYGMLLEALSDGLCASGADVYVAGTVPTPAIAYFTAKCEFDGGVMISASHNPYEYNGIKIFGKGGFKLSDAEEEEIEKLIEADNIPCKTAHGSRVYDNSLRELYVDYLRRFAPAPAGSCGIKAVIDCSNGAACATAPDVFSFLKPEGIFIGNSPDGKNINRGCGSTDLSSLREKVLEEKADIGIAFDGDADRFLAIDEVGREVDGDCVLAMLAESLNEKHMLKKQTIVGTVTTNYGFSEFCKKNGYTFISTKVGDRYVLEEIEKGGFSLGGEQSGHTVIREAATTGDGQLTALYILSRMAETKKPLSALASVMKKYPQHTVNLTASNDKKARISTDCRISEAVANARMRLRGKGRILVRPSGTEPVIRIMTESADEDTAHDVCMEVAEKIKALLAE